MRLHLNTPEAINHSDQYIYLNCEGRMSRPRGWQMAILWHLPWHSCLTHYEQAALLDYNFLRWLRSTLSVAVRIWVASLPQHWGLRTKINFGQNTFSYFWSSRFQAFHTRYKKIWCKQMCITRKLYPTCPTLALMNSTPQISRLQDGPRGQSCPPVKI